MKLKRILSIMLSLAMLLSMVPMASAAGEDGSADDCNHVDEAVITAPSCTYHDFTGGICSLCGYSVLGSDWLAPDFARGDYSFVAIPDTQSMVDLWPNEYYKQMKWIADNKEALNIQAAFHMGDMVESNSDGYWSIAQNGTDYLDRAGMVWMPMRGNHDDSEFFNSYYASFANKSCFGESYEEGKLDHYYGYVNAGGREYLILALGWAPGFSVLKWAQGVVESHPDKNVIIICHAYMNSDGTPLRWETDLSAEMRNELIANLPNGITPEMAMSLIPDGEDIWAAFKGYENVVLGLSGHVHSADIVSYTAANGAGKNVSSLLIDRQEDDVKDHLGMVALLSFHEDSDTVEVNWYSTRYDALYRANNQFTITVPHAVAKEIHTHSYAESVTAPSCTEKGYTTYTCACGEGYVDNHTEALGHKWDEGKVNDKGGITYTCTVCRIGITSSAPGHDHVYVSAVTAPGCTEQGYTTYTCACGKSYVDNYTKALGHKEVTDAAVAATCTESGLGEGKHCSVCKVVLVKQSVVAAFGHTEVTDAAVAATCTETGLTEGRHCSVCKEVLVKQEVVSALGHTYTETVTAPSCTEKGFTTHSCGCGESYKDNYTDALGHKWGKSENTKEPSIEAEGEKTYTCSDCGEKKTEKIDKLPDCKGKHSWDKGEVTKEPTNKSEGVKTFTCAVCGETKTEKIQRLPDVSDFKDIAEDDYFCDGVQWALDEGITTGMSKERFGPDEVCTRAQVVTFLWRAAGEPAPRSMENPFNDVKEGQYYYEAVLWAVEQGLTGGISENTFGTNSPCTRAQVVTFLWRAAGEPTPKRNGNSFADVAEGQYYCDAVLWAVESEITTGISENSFAPSVSCTRAQIVTFLYRAFK